MNRANYFAVIEDRLNTLAYRISSNGRLNILSLHTHSENFYQYFLKELYNWEITNENENQQNVEAIDLIDHINGFAIQVSATNTKQKVESSLSKDLIKTYKSYTFKFISIAKDAGNLRREKFKNPHGINFNPPTDIVDKNSILATIKGLCIDDQKRIYEFVKKELSGEVDLVKVESNLASVINTLSKENWDKKEPDFEINSFEIERKISYNNLVTSKDIIDDYRIHYGRVDKIYSEFDTLGINKSYSVLSTIRQEYIKEKNNWNDDKLFFEVICKIKEKVLNSSNYSVMPLDELELCINILVVDAFIRCKIFENPEKYNYVTT